MCLIVFSYKNHPKYDLILAANRDEAYVRPTQAAHFWDDESGLLAGKDLEAGGTWMGITKTGAFAALTNYRDPSIQKVNPPSRGQLVLDFLIDKKDTSSYLQDVHAKADQYMGFNLLAGSVSELYHYSNQEQKMNRVEPGIHGLSNHLLDTPWPKVIKAKHQLQQITSETLNEEELFKFMTDDRSAPDDELPNTGVDIKIEKQVSPVFIKSDQYGTRNSTLLLIDKSGHVTFEERRFKTRSTEVDETNRYEFAIE